MTTSNKIMLKGIKIEEHPVVYIPPKPKKIVPTEQDLQMFDKFGMGSIIGQITNRGAAAYAILPLLKEKYGINSQEYQITLSRLKQGCKAQSAQIDKTKIGQQVKGIPSCWVDKNKTNNEDLLLNKRPYFFKYLYKDSKKEYSDYLKQQEFLCQTLFRKTLSQTMDQTTFTEEEIRFMKNYVKWNPLIDSKSCMNLLCHYIENIDFHLKEKIRSNEKFNGYQLYKNKNIEYSEDQKRLVLQGLEEYNQMKTREQIIKSNNLVFENNDGLYTIQAPNLQEICLKYINNVDIILNILLDYFYEENPKSDKNIVWKFFGKNIFENIKMNSSNQVNFPFENENGTIEYFGRKYKIEQVILDE